MSKNEEPEWLEEATVLLFHQRQLAEHGGIAGMRDENMFLSALAKPQQLWCYGTPAPDLCQLAASYAFGLAKNHPFLDGNNRTAAIACETFLILNGRGFIVGEEEKYPVYLALAAGEMSEEDFAAWLRKYTASL
jgi:death on curing protein